MSEHKHCCGVMEAEVGRQCEDHPVVFDCPDHTVYYSKEFGEYGILIHDGGSTYSVIKYCPWCGKDLPTSKRQTGALGSRESDTDVR